MNLRSGSFKNFRLYLARLKIGHLSTADLPLVALHALEEGLMAPSLLILAGKNNKDGSFLIQQYFETALTELGARLPE